MGNFKSEPPRAPKPPRPPKPDKDKPKPFTPPTIFGEGKSPSPGKKGGF